MTDPDDVPMWKRRLWLLGALAFLALFQLAVLWLS